MSTYHIKAIQSDDRSWIGSFVAKHWGSNKVVTRGRLFEVELLPGYKALQQGKPIGLITFSISKNECEIITLTSLIENLGVGSNLITEVRKSAVEAGCNRLWLITTNDNINALRFYQMRGFSFVAVHRQAIEQSRRLKPEIPHKGYYGIPIQDEIELELML
ncbi:GNAT family N-acetyltransferase [candidate division CSSED10-310 bacterium]|uniref:GNAT family N-acetyltransferase n=1 Tax=candidate division CSSED10-310 bacterium TaxID=2855610 RepID=A0ABV6Z109_UNCC1